MTRLFFLFLSGTLDERKLQYFNRVSRIRACGLRTFPVLGPNIGRVQFQVPTIVSTLQRSSLPSSSVPRPRVKPSPLSSSPANKKLSQGLLPGWWTRGGRCSPRPSRRSWPGRPSASSGGATRSSASRRRAGARRAPTRSSSASASAPPSGCSRRSAPSPRTLFRTPASPSAASPSSTPAPTPARAPSASTSTRCPTGTTSASSGARASASSSPPLSCSASTNCLASYPDALFPASVYLLFRNFTHLRLSLIYPGVLRSSEMVYPDCYALFIP